MRAGLILLSLLAACGDPAPPATTTAAPTAPTALVDRSDVTAADFAKLHAQGVQLVDVRTPAEYAQGHVPGAINVPVDEVGPGHKDFDALRKDAPVYFVCQSGGRSGRAADIMASAGFKAVNITDGTAGWVKQGLPVE